MQANFLENEAKVICNLKLENGKFVGDFDAKKYATVLIVASNGSNAVSEIFPLEREEIKTRNLTHKSRLKNDQAYTVTRKNQMCLTNEKLLIEDLNSTEFQIIDSFSKFFEIQKELRSCTGKDSENGIGYDFWMFLKNWNNYTIDEKHKYYFEKSCDELNLFIYFRDSPYFETYIDEFLKNKLEKSFIDYFLIKDKTKLDAYSQPIAIKKLNALEKSLLVLFYVKEKNMEEASRIADILECQNKIVAYDSGQFKLFFDTVLSSKSTGTFEIKKELVQMAKEKNFINNEEKDFDGEDLSNSSRYSARELSVCYDMNMEEEENDEISGNSSESMEMEMKKKNKRQFKKKAAGKRRRSYNDEQECEEGYFAHYDESIKELRQTFQSGYKDMEKTKEYAERHYMNQKYLNEQYYNIKANKFWADYVQHLIANNDKPFLSANFMYCNKTHLEMLSALSIIGLPFENKKHEYNSQGKSLEITANSNLIVFYKEIREGKSELKPEIMLTQRFFDPKDRFTYSEEDPSVKNEKDVEEYIIDKIYGCQIIVTNCSVANQEFQILCEVPEGSLPVRSIDYIKSHTLFLNSFTTKTIEIFFYFPAPGNFKMFPANASRNGVVVAVGRECSLEVLLEKKSIKLENFKDILSKGSENDVLNFLETKNLLNQKIFNFSQIYYLLKKKEFFKKVVQILKKRKIVDEIVWSFSIYHGDVEIFKEALQLEDSQEFFKGVIKYFSNSIVHFEDSRYIINLYLF